MHSPASPAVESLDSAQAAELLASDKALTVLDVRGYDEYGLLGHLPQAQLKPLPDIEQWAQELSQEQAYLVVCQHGVRSWHACQYLHQLGFQELYNLEGGMAAWSGDMAYGSPV